MVFWRTAQPAQQASNAATASMDHTEELLAEVDEPPDEPSVRSLWSSAILEEKYMKAAPHGMDRRESLLTRQLHSEAEQSDGDHPSPPPRALSTHSTWSNTSTAELTSDDGHSVPSPAISPPLPPTKIRNGLAILEKPLDKRIKFVEQEEAGAKSESGSEKSVEATLGRKRCIMFACGGKDTAKVKPTSPPPAPIPEKTQSESPPKRKCMIKFACPARSGSETKTAQITPTKRPVSPPPPERKSASTLKPQAKQHRGSDSTVTHASPKSFRKSPTLEASSPTPTAVQVEKQVLVRKLSNGSDDSGTAATRFHEFASSEDEPDDWIKENTCYRSRLTIKDTLEKENVLRKACEQAEEEAVEEEEEEEEAVADEENAEVDDLDDVEAGEDDDEDGSEQSDDGSEHSDDGFHSDDEEGFADSDSDGEGSDYEWWKPGGSTAATSIEHLDRLATQAKFGEHTLVSSMGSASSGYSSPRRRHGRSRKRTLTQSMPIRRAEEPDLPDSTDFVCGTLDEDRPLEQEYINRKKEIEAAKHQARPQDIDPSFPTSDPEMDEEDDEDIEDPEESEDDDMVHGGMDELHGEGTVKRHTSPRPQARPTNRSPPPPTRYHSPPPSKRVSKHHSPPPSKRGTARSPPPPRKLFGGHSPKRARSPAIGRPMTSPPNSPSRGAAFAKASEGLARRPQLTHTASLPRGGFLLSAMCKQRREHDDSGSDTALGNLEVPKRGAIDIVKGLEKKRQRRKEKMWQKMCAKAAAKGDKAYKVKPGKGAERMREVGLELQKYHGKGEHILSV